MTDFFALLDQPRRSWLDLEKLKQAFHEKSRVAHPDAGGTEAGFAQINQAYQVLQEPKRRLQHLLALEGQSPTAAGHKIADKVADLFQSVGVATQEAERVLRKFSSASNPLSRSLLQPDLKRAQGRVEEALAALRDLQASADDELQELSKAETFPMGEDRIGELQRLYALFSYLTRWTGELEEKRVQLSSA